MDSRYTASHNYFSISNANKYTCSYNFDSIHPSARVDSQANRDAASGRFQPDKKRAGKLSRTLATIDSIFTPDSVHVSNWHFVPATAEAGFIARDDVILGTCAKQCSTWPLQSGYRGVSFLWLVKGFLKRFWMCYCCIYQKILGVTLAAIETTIRWMLRCLYFWECYWSLV